MEEPALKRQSPYYSRENTRNTVVREKSTLGSGAFSSHSYVRNTDIDERRTLREVLQSMKRNTPPPPPPNEIFCTVVAEVVMKRCEAIKLDSLESEFWH